MSDTTLPADGATPTEDTSAPAVTAPAEDAPTDGAGEDTAAAAGDEPKGKTYEESYVKKLRTENANARTAKQAEAEARQAAETALAEKAAEAEKLSQILAGLNSVLNPEAPKETPLDPAKLADQLAQAEQASTAALAERDATIRALKVENALPSIYAEKKADPGLTTAVLKASGALADVDPTSKTFAADLESAVEAALEANPRLRVAPAVTTTGTEPTGRSGATDQLTADQLAGMSPEAIVKAQNEGRLNAILGR